MVLLPVERGMTLTELRQMAAHQQHQIEVQQQLLVAKEQRLKFLKQQEARQHNLSEQHTKSSCMITLRDKVEAQELKLKQLRTLRGQVEQQKTNNSNLGTELDSIRALFSEKEKELNLAVSKVEELACQLDEIRNNSQKSYFVSSTSELENLRRELTYQTKLSEQQNNHICQQREKICNRQQDITILDSKINELNERLHRKRLVNEQIASQIHLSPFSYNSSCSIINNNMLIENETRVQEISDPEHTQDDLAAHLHTHKYDFGEFSLTKKDPKYQTLPYNTKFTLKEKQSEDSLSSSSSSTTTATEEESTKSENSNDEKNIRPFSNMFNFSPRPFNSGFSGSPGVQKFISHTDDDDVPSTTQSNEEISDESSIENINENKGMCIGSVNKKDLAPANVKVITKALSNSDFSIPGNVNKTVKPAVPPKPALSVKPMLLNRESHPSSCRKNPEQDSVTMALTFLKNKSSEKEKNDFRYSAARNASQDPLLPRSRILTYFSKTLLQPDGGMQKQSENPNAAEIPKRKSSFGQLPIKPKPLTIRKTPGIEPPKLKIQSFVPSSRKPADLASKVPKTLSMTKTDEKTISTEQKSKHSKDASSGSQSSNINDEAVAEKTELPLATNISDTFQGPESAAVKSSEGNELANYDDTDSLSYQSDEDRVDQLSSALQKMKKGNLKGEGSIRASRRVSFDPLALLLDAALEGELELVKKIASEVVNASAANDEGITALHNAICAGQFEVVKFLVEFGCDVNAPDSDGWTPLHCAASCNNLAMVKFLVERGACIFATTHSDQETAAEKCEEDGAGFDGCSEFLFSLQDNLGVVNNGIVYAVYEYDVQNADELSFRNGDMLTVLRRSDDEENEWWWCCLHNEEGYVPRNLLGLYPRVSYPNAEKST